MDADQPRGSVDVLVSETDSGAEGQEHSPGEVQAGSRLNGTFLEVGFPHQRVSQLVEADRRARYSLYRAHRWFARRPPALMRSILIAAHMPSDAVEDEFCDEYS